MFQSIKTKILVLQLGLVLSIAVTLGVSTYVIMHRSLMKCQQEHLKDVTTHIGKELNSLIAYKEQLLEKIGTSEVVESYFKKRQKSLLIEYFNKFTPQFPILSYVNEDGLEEFKLANGEISEELFNIRDSEIFEEATWHTNKTFSSSHVLCPELGGPYIHFSFCNHSYFDEFVGLILGKVPIVTLAKDIQRFRFGKSGFAVLLSADGTILSCRDKDKLLNKITIEGPDRERIISGIKAMKTGFGHATILGIDGYLAYAPVKGQDWVAVVILPYEEFMAELNTLRNTVLLVSFIVLIAGITLSLILANKITRPILKLVDKTDLIASGYLSQKTDIKSNDEIGILAQSFDKMAQNLRKSTTSIVNLNREIDGRKKAEQALEKLNKDLESTVQKLSRSNKELQEFAHIAAHDLKSPLRAIGTLADWLATDYIDKLDERGKERINLIMSRAKRVDKLVDNILQYSEVGRIDQKEQKVDLNVLLSEVISEIKPPENVEITVENELPTIICSKRHMVLVFRNLLSNAVRYMDNPKGQIKVGCSEENESWRFSVCDNGPGIEQKYFEKIFQIFQTLSPRDEVEAIGIGLSLTKKIVELYSGRIWVESKVGEGSTFYFTLPKQEMGVKDAKHEANIAR